MSYCRVGEDSDVYVISTRNPVLQCFCGPRGEDGNYTQPFPAFTTRSGMAAHLRWHLREGDRVPEHTFERLEREIAEQGDEMG